MNKKDVFIVGGKEPSLLAYEYDSSRSCLKVDMDVGVVSEMACMGEGRI